MSAWPDRGLRILSTRDLAAIEISPAEVVEIVERAYLALAAGTSANPRKIKTSPQDGRSVSYSMLGRDGARDLVGFKTSYKHQPAADRDQQAYFTSLQLYDDRTGRPVALLDCGRVGAMRTPAVSALLARHCAPPDSETALVVGTGTQGRQALPFLLTTMPGLRRLLVHGTHPDGLRAVAELLTAHHPDREVEVVTDLRAAAGEADVVVATAGAATAAAIEASWLRPGALCILVGHGLAPSTLGEADRVIATSAAQMAVTGTDMADAEGNLRTVDAELPDILAGRASGRETPGQRVFAYNSGLVVTDIALGHRLAELAEGRGLGQVVELWS
jgi:ornithine cyclodeaminase/alanine dehydrogenase-like protein (mu-crystallin family)